MSTPYDPTSSGTGLPPGAVEPLDDLDLAFRLPDNISDPNLRKLYEILVVRMRREASHLTMSTVQQLLIERIAYNYILMRHKEAAATPEEGGFQHAGQQKEYNSFWLAMTQEFNKQLRGTDADQRASMMRVMAEIVGSILREIDDPVLQSRMRMKIADALANEGL